ncbi:MAG: asparagine synthase (glutamine-hydrolyzing) [Luteitalea sp.]|nr:asparagine synthase (glutamine-hydrolyzing) [Luteitalea sp.]
MCGLVGFWQPADAPADQLEGTVCAMARTLAHRGPDDDGVWVDETRGVALGFRRLAILDLTPTGHQPMVSSDGRYVIVFNGEIYNFRDLRAELEAEGVQFRGTSDTEVMLEGARVWGVDSLWGRLWGMFAAALWDRRERSLYLVRDRLGKKPLYYGHAGGVLLFASELKALRAHRAFDARVDRAALAAYLRFAYVPTPRSIYQGISKVPPGASLRFDAPRAEAHVERYWDARQVVVAGRDARRQLADSDAVGELDALLRDAVRRRMIADVPLGAFLSGGLDSTTVVAAMQAESSRPVKTFTVGFAVEGYNEAEHAKAVANHLGTDHTELYVSPREVREVIPRLPHIYDEPFADPSQMPTCLIAALARQHVTVALSGDGGDELFGGYTRYQWAQRVWRAVGWAPRWSRRAAADLVTRASPRQWDVWYGAIEPWLPTHLRQSHASEKMYKLASVADCASPDQIYLRLVSQWEHPDAVVLGAPQDDGLLASAEAVQLVPNFIERMMWLDLVTYLPDDILVKVDRASMGTSLEARAPLLDHRVVEWVWRLPLGFKIRSGQSKWLLRQVLQRYVQPDLIDRPKMGFGVPVGAWLRQELREWAEALLDERRLGREGYFDPTGVRRVWQMHLSGQRNEERRLWVILMFQAWLDAGATPP